MIVGFVLLHLACRQIVDVTVKNVATTQCAAIRFIGATDSEGRIAPRFLIHDRDPTFGRGFRQRVKNCGTRSLATPPRAPRANAFCERMIGTLRRDCLDHILVRDEAHAQRVLREYVDDYHGRPHRGLRMQPPMGSRWLPPARAPPASQIGSRPILGGLHHEYFILPE